MNKYKITTESSFFLPLVINKNIPDVQFYMIFMCDEIYLKIILDVLCLRLQQENEENKSSIYNFEMFFSFLYNILFNTDIIEEQFQIILSENKRNILFEWILQFSTYHSLSQLSILKTIEIYTNIFILYSTKHSNENKLNDDFFLEVHSDFNKFILEIYESDYFIGHLFLLFLEKIFNLQCSVLVLEK